MSDPRPLHRLFGLSWIDFFQGSAMTVETEIDLSIKQQFLDLVLIRKGSEPIARPLPDGFDDLADHNLLTFKSHQEALDDWALYELVGHYVNYRKQASPSMQNLLPASDFRLLAVCARFPHNLAQEVTLTPVREGVYEVRLLTMSVRVIVVNQLPRMEHNAMLHLFGAREELLRYGQEHYRPHSAETSSLLYELFKAYSEDPTMPDKLQEFVRQSIDQLLASLPADELRKRLSTEERLKGLPAEERLKGLPAEELRKRLSAEERLKGLTADEVVKALPPEMLEALARRLKANGSSPQSP
jgi:hypothetical protein